LGALMNKPTFAVMAFAACALSACSKPSQPETEAAPGGRYLGVGIYRPGAPWSRVADAQQPADPAAAKRSDDQVIIVVEDSRTGELRACGDLSGYCIGMNPWRTDLVPSREAPIRLTDHAASPSEADGAGQPAHAGPALKRKPFIRPAREFTPASPGNTVG
jgi:hypothetical protein